MLKKTITYLSIIFITIGAVFMVVQAGSEHNTAGFAWSENTGWISFNSDSDGSPVNYGVNIDLDTGDLSGYAWSEHIGWVSFNRSDTGNPPANPYKTTGGAIAKYDFDSRELTGWMKVLANDGGWDGWIRFCDGTIATCNEANEIARIDTNGDWHGWAWSDMVVGWLSFNSNPTGGGGSAYKVTSDINRPPTASDLSVVEGDYCTSPAHYFSWIYSDEDGDNENQFQFQVDNNSGFGSPEVDKTIDGSWSDGDANNQIVIVAVSPSADQIGYNTTYYWRVRVRDVYGKYSDWTEGSSFTTILHRCPTIDFNYSPEEPSQDEAVLFSDQSVVYGGATISNWSWTFENGNPATSNIQNPSVQFTSVGSNQVTLQVTDSDGLSCPGSKTIDIQIKLPSWKEILPW